MLYGVTSDGLISESKIISDLSIKGVFFSFHQNHSIIVNRLSFATGFGIQSNGYSSSYTPSIQNATVNFQMLDDSIKYKRNKLSCTHITIPIELRFSTNQQRFNNPFKLAAGFQFAYLLQSHTKFEESGKNGLKNKTYLTNDLNRLRYGPTIRIGAGPLQLYGFYSINNLLKQKSNQRFQTFNVGINMSLTYKPDELKNIFEELDKPKNQTTTFNF